MTGKVDRAGIIPYYVTEDDEILMMFMIPSDPSYGGSQYQIAKGKVDPGESHETAAVREGEEELGLLPSNMKGDVDFVGVFLGRMHIYTVEVSSLTDFKQPHYETGQVGWLTIDQFLEIGRDLHHAVVERVYSQITRKMGK